MRPPACTLEKSTLRKAQRVNPFRKLLQTFVKQNNYFFGPRVLEVTARYSTPYPAYHKTLNKPQENF